MKSKIIVSMFALGLLTGPTMSSAEQKPASGHESSHASQTENQTGAIEIILKDHQYIRQMIAKLNKELNSDPEKSHATFNELKDFLSKHEAMEQKLWYPELEKNDKLKPIITHLIKEEEDASALLKKIDDTKDEKQWVSEVNDLSKAVEHHAKDEETKLFPKVKEVLDKTTLNAIGEKLKAYHDENNMKY